jgi:hypothetical protein
VEAVKESLAGEDLGRGGRKFEIVLGKLFLVREGTNERVRKLREFEVPACFFG